MLLFSDTKVYEFVGQNNILSFFDTKKRRIMSAWVTMRRISALYINALQYTQLDCAKEHYVAHNHAEDANQDAAAGHLALLYDASGVCECVRRC